MEARTDEGGGGGTQLFLNTWGHQGALGRAVGEPFPECATQPWEDVSFFTLGCRAQEHFTSQDVETALSTLGSPSENAPAQPGAQMSAASLQGILAAPRKARRGTRERELRPRVQNSKSPPPHFQPQFPVTPSKSLSPACPPSSPIPSQGATHILSSASPPSAKFSGNIRLEGCSRERSSDREAVAERLLGASCWCALAPALITSSAAMRVRAGGGSCWPPAPRGPGLLQPLPPAASGSRVVPFPLAREGDAGNDSGKLSVLCAGFLCARRHQCARGGVRGSSRHPCSRGGHLGRALAGSPQTHRAT